MSAKLWGIQKTPLGRSRVLTLKGLDQLTNTRHYTVKEEMEFGYSNKFRFSSIATYFGYEAIRGGRGW